ncbi:enoyl-CoA hydratase/isomerase family protein [Nocardioides pacificus]
MPLTVLDLDGGDWTALQARARSAPAGPVVGTASSALPGESASLLDALTLTLAPCGPGRGWVHAPGSLAAIEATVAAAPLASATLVDLLGITARLDVPRGLVAESLAYSLLLGGPEFAAWRARTPRRDVPPADEPVIVARAGDVLQVTLHRPERHNAFGRAVRDGLLEALAIAELDASVTEVRLSGAGPSYCSGGDLDEFGTAPGIVEAHRIRLERSAGHAVHRLRDRVRPVLHGACIGAGIEVPAFARRVVAREGAFFCLPEVALGLVPGAGGTVSITHRIGPQRTAWLALTGARLDLDTALAWGLVDGRA